MARTPLRPGRPIRVTMKVVLFHPVALPPKAYGGVERVVLWLAKGLVEAGHEVHVAALAGSRLPPGSRLIPIDPSRPSALELPSLLPSGVEVVHFMAPPEKGVWSQLPCAGLVTVHGNGKPDERFHANTVFLSADHARRHGGSVYVHNGIDPDEYEFVPGRSRERFTFLSKTSWKVKNVEGAIRLCARAGAPLDVAGGHRPWRARARVALTRGMRWIGPVDQAAKAALLAGSRGLVFPMLWDEPFGLVMVEALMSGAPVLANPRGAAPEIVTPGTGFLPRDEEEWLRLLSSASGFPAPEACRAHALAMFHYSRMTAEYAMLYRKVAGGQRLNSIDPMTRARPEHDMPTAEVSP
jgi:glycosyltransferase involved in cell wall biosynthesis